MLVSLSHPSLQVLGPGPTHNGRNLVIQARIIGLEKKCTLIPRPLARPPSMYCTEGLNNWQKCRIKVQDYKLHYALFCNSAISLVTLKIWSKPKDSSLYHSLFSHDRVDIRPQLSINEVRLVIG